MKTGGVKEFDQLADATNFYLSNYKDGKVVRIRAVLCILGKTQLKTASTPPNSAIGFPETVAEV